MPRRAAKEPESHSDDPPIIARALVIGENIRSYYVGPQRQRGSNLATPKQPRRREVIAALNETTGLMRFFRYVARIDPTPALVISLQELLRRPEMVGTDAERQLQATALHEHITRAHWGSAPEELSQAKQPLLTLQARLLLDLSETTLPIIDQTEIETSVLKKLQIALQPNIRRLLTEIPANAVRKLSLGGLSTQSLQEEYRTALALSDPINTLAAAIFGTEDLQEDRPLEDGPLF